MLFYGTKQHDWSWAYRINREEKEELLIDNYFQAIEETLNPYLSSQEPISLSFELDSEDHSSKVLLVFLPRELKAFGISFSPEELNYQEAIFKLSQTFDLSFNELLKSPFIKLYCNRLDRFCFNPDD